MLTTIAIYFGVLILLFLLGVPVAFSLGVTSLVAMIYQFGFDIPYDIIAQRMVSGVNNFTILAVPFFLFAGKVMNAGGITNRIFNFANLLVGHIPGGLGHTNIVASMFFAGMSGAAVSDAAGLGTIELHAMEEAGYDRKLSVAITAASSTVGPIIPPSIPMVFYAVQGSVSVGALFIGGLIPGVLMGLTLMGMVYIYALRGKCPPPAARPTFREFMQGFIASFLPLMTPVILIGGIYSGIFTPTEAAVVAALYALLLGTVFLRAISWRGLGKILIETVRDTVVMTFIVTCAFIYGWLVVSSGLPRMFSSWLLALTTNPIVILLIINVFLLLVGCFLETIVAILILTPILMPIINAVGIDPVHFGVVMVLNLMIGILTPPFGLVTFVLARISKLPLGQVIRATLPFLIPLLITLILLSLFPSLVTFLPRLAMGGGS
jgi:tripartite ATP-independent transporter DctM subunit